MHRTTFVPRSRWLVLLVAVLATLASTRAHTAHAQEPLTPIVTIPAGEFRQVQMSKKQNIREARSDNPKVVKLFADMERPNVINVEAKSPGATKVFLTDADKNTEVFEVRVVTPGEKTPEEKRREFLDAVQIAFPAASIHVRFAGEIFVVHGDAGIGTSNADGGPALRAIAERTFGKNNYVLSLDRSGVQQVCLEVVVAVVNRSETRNMSFSFFNNRTNFFTTSVLQAPLNMANTLAPGIGAAATGLVGNPNLIFGVIDNRNGFTGFLQALRTEGLAKVLSEPRITTLSGKAAYINSGGEVPTFATSSLGQAEITYKAFGTTVEFLPIVMAGDRIYLEVRPEISDIDESLRVTLGANTAPGFRTRRAQCAVQMEDGQTLAIGGLIQNTINATVTKVPFLGDLPFFGAGFRNLTYAEKEEELVILVTPRLVDPISCTGLPKYLPGRETRTPDDYELFLEGILEAPRGQRTVCYGNDCGWHAAHSKHNGLYPCGDGSYSHLSNKLSGHGCRPGLAGPCRSGLCPTSASGHGSAPTETAPARLPSTSRRAPESAPAIVVDVVDPEAGRVIPASGAEESRLPAAPGLPMPILEDPR